MSKYFSYNSSFGFEQHDTAEEAREAAANELAECRADAIECNRWVSNVDGICWGQIFGEVVKTDCEAVDYSLVNLAEPQKFGKYGGFTTLMDQVANLAKVVFLTTEVDIVIQASVKSIMVCLFKENGRAEKQITINGERDFLHDSVFDATYVENGVTVKQILAPSNLYSECVMDVIHMIACAIDSKKNAVHMIAYAADSNKEVYQ